MSCLAKKWWSCTGKPSRPSNAAMLSQYAAPLPMPTTVLHILQRPAVVSKRDACRSNLLGPEQRIMCAYHFPMCENDVKEHKRICRSSPARCVEIPEASLLVSMFSFLLRSMLSEPVHDEIRLTHPCTHSSTCNEMERACGITLPYIAAVGDRCANEFARTRTRTRTCTRTRSHAHTRTRA
jgi:hypothetical protein